MNSQRRRVIGGVIIAVGGVLIVLALLNKGSGRDNTSQPPQGNEPIITRMSKAQTQEAERLVLEDRQFQELTAGVAPLSLEPVTWTSANGRTLVGADVTVRLSEPLSAGPSIWRVVFPAAAGRPNSHPQAAYVLRKAQLEVKNATELVAAVDLRKHKVVGLQPDGPHVEVKVLHMYGPPVGAPYREPRGY
jgi:hypothetical protein